MVISDNSGFVITDVNKKIKFRNRNKLMKITIVSDLVTWRSKCLRLRKGTIRSSLGLGVRRGKCWWKGEYWLGGAQSCVAWKPLRPDVGTLSMGQSSPLPVL